MKEDFMKSSPFLYTINQIRDIEKRALSHGISGETLMERAGHAAGNCLTQQFPSMKRLIIFCGGGNNGGDGYALASIAHKKGIPVAIRFIDHPEKLKNEAKLFFDHCQSLPIEIQPFDFHEKLQADIFVDALLGIGIQGTIRDPVAKAITYLNQSKIPILSLDIPSGLNADTGHTLGSVVNATKTITFIGLKPGLFTAEGKDCCGDILCDSLNLPGPLFDITAPYGQLIFSSDFASFLPPRKKNTHKGDYGRVLIVGGDHGMYGAPFITALGALRSGSGMVSTATHRSACLDFQPEIMSHSIKTARQLQPLLEWASVIVLGPGLGQSAWSQKIFKKVIQAQRPMIMDADGLRWLAKFPAQSNNWILTPHPGEAAQLLQIPVETVQENRFEAARLIQKKYGGITVLKGAGTLIANDTGSLSITPLGNPGMASGGMGDLLAGIIAGLAAQHVPNSIAASLGACLHAEAGDLAAKEEGERGLLATDLLPYLRRLVNLNPKLG